LRILLTGRNGQAGAALERVLPGLGELVATDRSRLDLGDAGAIRRVVREVAPQLIVNPAAYTAVDKAETEQDAATRVNAIAPGVLAEEARRLGALLVHYSTDFVFDGAKRAPYLESDAPGPLSHYGRTKRDGESAVLASGCRHLILRTSWVYGPRATNFFQVIRRKAAANEPMQMTDDHRSVPTSGAFLAEYTVALLKRQATGLLHLVPSGSATRYDFALEVVKAMQSRSTVEAVSSERFPAPARRPGYSVMANAAAAKALAQALPDWRIALERSMQAWTQP
jgi:dTDP-4-dehydrorhamnose reductase